MGILGLVGRIALVLGCRVLVDFGVGFRSGEFQSSRIRNAVDVNPNVRP